MNKLILVLLLAVPAFAQDNKEIIASLDKLLDGKAMITYYYVPSSAQSVFINIPVDKKDARNAEALVKDAQQKVLDFLKPSEPTFIKVMASREKRYFIPRGSECLVTQTQSHLTYTGSMTITSYVFGSGSYVSVYSRISGGYQYTPTYSTSTCYPPIAPIAVLDWSNMPLKIT